MVCMPTEFDYNLTVDESRTMAGLNSRATFDGHRIRVRQNLTLLFLNESCAIFTLELRVGSLSCSVALTYKNFFLHIYRTGLLTWLTLLLLH